MPCSSDKEKRLGTMVYKDLKAGGSGKRKRSVYFTKLTVAISM